MSAAVAPIDRVLARVVHTPGPLPDPCWVPTYVPHHSGYVEVSNPTGQPKLRAHRITYLALVGPIPAGLDLDHVCRVRACCNPAHLEPVTRSENLSRSPLVGRHERRAACAA